jgi:hypothetical protein
MMEVDGNGLTYFVSTDLKMQGLAQSSRARTNTCNKRALVHIRRDEALLMISAPRSSSSLSGTMPFLNLAMNCALF